MSGNEVVFAASRRLIAGGNGIRYRRRTVSYRDLRAVRRRWIARRNSDGSLSPLGNSWRYEIEVEGEEPFVLWGKLYPEDEKLESTIARRAGVTITDE